MGPILVIIFAAAVSLAQDLSQEAAQAMRNGRFAEAERLYRQLTQQDSKNPGWHANLGLALHSQQKYREAAEALERSLRMKSSPGLSVVLGFDYLKLNEPCKAIAPLERTDRIDALADAYYGCKRFPEAARMYTKRNDIRSAARSWWQAREYGQAKPLYEKLSKLHQREPDFAWEYGDTLYRADGAEVALPWLERATSIVEGRAALGRAYVEVGRFSDAIPHLEAAVKADPDLLLPLSRAYKELGRAAEADRALNEYRKKQSRQN